MNYYGQDMPTVHQKVMDRIKSAAGPYEITEILLDVAMYMAGDVTPGYMRSDRAEFVDEIRKAVKQHEG